ncbi:MAG: c-type cytochrome [Herminiimonas sp.]|nr:c-type cytochrome [Herminiimonas sp.]
MCRLTNAILLTLAAMAPFAADAGVGADAFAGIGRTATAQEIAAWDIDVRADFKGLPKGAGTVQKGQDVWEGKCASCHGVFGESNSVFTPIIGGTTVQDIASGRVAALASGVQPQRTTMMKASTVSTLWDYIRRAMPWNAPKSLTTEEVYAVTGYILHMAEVVPADFTLSDQNIAEVQKKMPNRNGMTQKHGMWDVKGAGDVRNVACMRNCKTETTIASSLPETTRGASGNLSEQNRPFGPVRGVSTTKVEAANRGSPAKPVGATASGVTLLNTHGCIACHGMRNKIVGPGFNEITARYQDDAIAQPRLQEKIRMGGSGAWGPVPMPPHPTIKDDDIKTMVQWILTGS